MGLCSVKRILLFLCIALMGVLTACFYRDETDAAGNEATKDPIENGQVTPENVIDYNYYPKEYRGYRYPVLPGTDKWPYGNHGEMVAICQIPQEVLDGMTTEELLESVLQYPLYADVYAYDSVLVGAMAVRDHFNGMSELAKRADCAQVMIEFARTHNLSDYKLRCDFYLLEDFHLSDFMSTEEINELIH